MPIYSVVGFPPCDRQHYVESIKHKEAYENEHGEQKGVDDDDFDARKILVYEKSIVSTSFNNDNILDTTRW